MASIICLSYDAAEAFICQHMTRRASSAGPYARQYANGSLFNHSVFAASDAAHVDGIDDLLEKLAVLHMAGAYAHPLLSST